MSKWLQTILSWIGYVPKSEAPAPQATNLGLSITSDIGAVAGALKSGLDLGLTITQAKNTPAYLAAVELQRKRAAMDQVRLEEEKARKGDKDALNQIRKNVSVLIAVLLLSSCATYAPPLSHSRTIAPSGNDIDAGIIGPCYDSKGNFRGYQVRQSAVDDYNFRLSQVGSKLIPPVKPGAGLTKDGDYWLMTSEAYDRWAGLYLGLLP